jgi:hypothetical protein
MRWWFWCSVVSVASAVGGVAGVGGVEVIGGRCRRSGGGGGDVDCVIVVIGLCGALGDGHSSGWFAYAKWDNRK